MSDGSAVAGTEQLPYTALTHVGPDGPPRTADRCGSGARIGPRHRTNTGPRSNGSPSVSVRKRAADSSPVMGHPIWGPWDAVGPEARLRRRTDSTFPSTVRRLNWPYLKSDVESYCRHRPARPCRNPGSAQPLRLSGLRSAGGVGPVVVSRLGRDPETGMRLRGPIYEFVDIIFDVAWSSHFAFASAFCSDSEILVALTPSSKAAALAAIRS
jgi:hypothetical protein